MGESSKGQTLRERTEESNLRLWMLLWVNRWLLAGMMLVGMFFGIVLLSVLDLSPIQVIIGQTGVIRTMFGPFIGSSIITAVTLVVTLNQLVISQELGAIGDQRDRMSEAMDFRRDVESTTGIGLSPPEPSAFLRQLITSIQDRTETLHERVSAEADQEL